MLLWLMGFLSGESSEPRLHLFPGPFSYLNVVRNIDGNVVSSASLIINYVMKNALRPKKPADGMQVTVHVLWDRIIIAFRWWGDPGTERRLSGCVPQMSSCDIVHSIPKMCYLFYLLSSFIVNLTASLYPLCCYLSTERKEREKLTIIHSLEQKT